MVGGGQRRAVMEKPLVEYSDEEFSLYMEKNFRALKNLSASEFFGLVSEKWCEVEEILVRQKKVSKDDLHLLFVPLNEARKRFQREMEERAERLKLEKEERAERLKLEKDERDERSKIEKEERAERLKQEVGERRRREHVESLMESDNLTIAMILSAMVPEDRAVYDKTVRDVLGEERLRAIQAFRSQLWEEKGGFESGWEAGEYNLKRIILPLVVVS